MVALACVVVGAIGGGRIDVLHYGWRIPALVTGFIVMSILLTNSLCKAVGYPSQEGFTLAIEVAMRNGNLGVALCIPLFGALSPENVLHQGALYTCLFGGGAMLVVGMVAVARRHFRFSRQRKAGSAEA